jgi:hypothetical protein
LGQRGFRKQGDQSGRRERRSGIFIGLDSEIFGLAKFPFSLIPKFLIPPDWSAIFVPDFASAYSDVLFIGPCQMECCLSQFVSQFQYPLRGLRITYHPSYSAVPLGFGQNTGHHPFSVHGKFLRRCATTKNCDSKWFRPNLYLSVKANVRVRSGVSLELLPLIPVSQNRRLP